jgi:uncharacterized protein (DUF2384 family)
MELKQERLHNFSTRSGTNIMEKEPEAHSRIIVKRTVCDLIDIYEGDVETALLWLLEPLQALNGRRPVDCFSDQAKTLQLQVLIKKLEQGDFS